MPLDMEESAIVVWLPEGEKPNNQSFELTNDFRPPIPNPENWHTLRGAIENACTVDISSHNKLPWIKVGKTTLDPKQIKQMYNDNLSKTP